MDLKQGHMTLEAPWQEKCPLNANFKTLWETDLNPAA